MLYLAAYIFLLRVPSEALPMRRGGRGISPQENQSVITLEKNQVRFVKTSRGLLFVIASGDCAIEGSEEWPTRQRVGQGVLVQAMHQDASLDGGPSIERLSSSTGPYDCQDERQTNDPQ